MGVYRQALQLLRPTSKISFTSSVESYETLHWKDSDTNPPSKEEVEELVAVLQSAWDQWAEDRASAYPTVEEQLDLLWHTINNGEQLLKGCNWFEQIRRAKASTPKPE